MAPNPITATHRLEVVASGGTRPHKLRWYVNAVPSGDSDGYDFAVHGGGGVGMSVAVTTLVNLLKPLFNVDMTLGNIQLFQYLSGAYIPVASDPTSVVGTTAGNHIVANQLTLTYRSTTPRNLLRQVFLEHSAHVYLGKGTATGDFGVNFGAYLTAMLNPVSPEPGSWSLSRSGHIIVSLLAGVYTLNKRIKRDAGDE